MSKASNYTIEHPEEFYEANRIDDSGFNSLTTIWQGKTKAQLTQAANDMVANTFEGGNPFDAAEILAAMEHFSKEARKNGKFVEYLRDELAKHHGKVTTPSGAKIEVCETGTSYDYSQTLEWQQMDALITDLVEKKKKLEAKLRTIPAGQIIVDMSDGEIMLVGPAKTSKSTYKVTLAK